MTPLLTSPPELADTPAWLKGTVHGAFLTDLRWTLNGIPDIVVVVILLLFSITAKKAEGIAITAIDESQQTPQGKRIGLGWKKRHKARRST